jgi:site-specific DNA-methyltransferase (adenine-specific)
MSTIKVILGDCMEIMAQYEPKHFDLAVVDPPYGIGEDGGKCRTRGSKKTNGINKGWDSYRPSKFYFLELLRVSKNQIIWGGNYFADVLSPSRCWIYWQKDLGGDFADGELAWTSFDSVLKQYKKRSETFNRIHPTQKPVALYDWIYQKYLPEGGKVLDTHGGSMSNVISWIKAGNIDGVCTEIDPDYFHDAKKRIQNFLAQQDMFRNPVTVEFIENKMSMK